MRLESERVYLRSLMESDAPVILEGTQDKEIRYMTGTAVNFTLEQIEKHIKDIMKDPARYDFAICMQNSDEMIGDLTVDIDEKNKKAGFRIAMVSIPFTGKGYGTEAIKLVQRFVFEELALNRLQLEVFSHNVRGIRSYEKAGFVQEGILRQSLYYNQSFSDEIIMAILKCDYEKLSL